MKIKEIISKLEFWAPPSYQESYDNSGLLVGNSEENCSGCLISLDATEQVVEEAIERKCNLIISHHPIIFGGLKRITGRNYVERTVLKAIKNNICLYAIHTNLDNVHTGVNKKIADLIGLTDTRILVPKKNLLTKLVTFVPHNSKDGVLEALFSAGAGKIGNYEQCSFSINGTGTFLPNDDANPVIGKNGRMEAVEESRIEVIFENHKSGRIIQSLFNAHPYEEVAYYLTQTENEHQEVGSGMFGELNPAMESHEFLLSLKEKMNINCIRHTSIHQKEIQKVAVCGGAGSFLLKSAKMAGADIFITADYKYHEFFDAEDQIIIADIGHYESEVYTKELIYDFLKENLTNIALHSSEVNTNPINYL